MFRKLHLFGIAVSLIAVCGMITSCGGDDATEETTEVAQEVTLAEFDTSPVDFVGKTLSITGTVDHVCRHGGKKMFIMGENPEERLKVEAGTEVGA
ncbi:MAG: hypothetical protein DRP45_08030, partial [Candidatus Zixiibacteriota bacterium]